MKRWQQSRKAQATAALAVLLGLNAAVGVAEAQTPAAKDSARAIPQSGPRAQAPRMVPIVPPEPKQTAAVAPQREADKSLTVADQYCRAVLEPAREARYAHQTAEVEALNRALDERMAKIETKISELKEWVARREDFANRTSEQLVSIYSGMRPDAASEQLAKIEESTAAAILSKLAPRVASQILNDMPADRAARLAMILMGASRKNDPGDGS